MIVYQSTKAKFLTDVHSKDIEEVILAAYKERTGSKVAPAEIKSWKASLTEVAKVLYPDEIPGDCGVAIEYGIPQTSKRIDFLLSGLTKDRKDELIIIELKQWDKVKKTSKDAIVRTRFSGGETDTSHPSYQAWSYASLLSSFNEAVYQANVGLRPCAYLHNYTDDGVLTDRFYGEYIDRAPLFLKGEGEREKLRQFILGHVRYGDSGKLLYRIENGRIRPSKGLVQSLLGMLRGKSEFVLIDDQKVVYETALAVAADAEPNQKQVIIIEGGPGTGKSVVAINLLVELTAREHLAKYVTKNAAPRKVFESVLTGTYKKTQISNLFAGSGEFTATRKNTFDTLIVDEAHRLNEKSGLYGNLGDNQIKELIHSAKCTIFFLDEDQRVTFKDIGEAGEIEKLAAAAGASVTRLELASQFRCSGSDGYLAWLDSVLQIRETANTQLDPSDFDFQVFDSPEKLRRVIVEKNKAANRARMVAGYCWDWKSKKTPAAFDVTIPDFGFSMRWNLEKDAGLWIVAPDSVSEIGCIHTCQGLEVDYIGVVVGPDLIVRDGKVLTVPEKRSKQDQSIKGYKKLLEADPLAATEKAERIIKNTYRTLMTRGMKGCYVYFADPETAEYFRSHLRCADDLTLLKVAEDEVRYQ
ncbi:MAG: DUF2075 domain-containing protein [Steroidobacteraceae bacterium]